MQKDKVSYRQLINLLIKYKKLKVVFVDSDGEISRERVLTNRGSCVVRYPKVESDYSSYEYNGTYMAPKSRHALNKKKQIKFSRYDVSCFRESYNDEGIPQWLWTSVDKKVASKLIVTLMQNHDEDECIFIQKVFTGKNFKRQIV